MAIETLPRTERGGAGSYYSPKELDEMKVGAMDSDTPRDIEAEVGRGTSWPKIQRRRKD